MTKQEWGLYALLCLIAGTAAAVLGLVLGVVLFDAFLWEATGSCQDCLLLYHIDRLS